MYTHNIYIDICKINPHDISTCMTTRYCMSTINVVIGGTDIRMHGYTLAIWVVIKSALLCIHDSDLTARRVLSVQWEHLHFLVHH